MDIVERLREKAHDMQSPPTMELRQAADEIERLREALRFYSERGNPYDEKNYPTNDGMTALQQKTGE